MRIANVRTPTVLLCLPLCILWVGCGGAEKEYSRESANALYSEGREALEQGDFPTAQSKLTEAVEMGWLNPDFTGRAMVLTTVAMAAQGNYEEAHAKLDELEKEPIPADLVLSARSFVLQKQGKNRQAKLAWSRARRINRSVRKFDFN